jgi:hypothetical protein
MSNFYRSLPHWMISSVDNKDCPQCRKVLRKNSIIGVGVKTLGEELNSLYVEYKCKQCKYIARVSFELQIKHPVEELCYTLLDEINKRKASLTAKKITKKELIRKKQGPISDKEAQDFVKRMNDSNNFDELLRLIKADHLAEPYKTPKDKHHED